MGRKKTMKRVLLVGVPGLVIGFLFGWLFAVVHGDISIEKTATLHLEPDNE